MKKLFVVFCVFLFSKSFVLGCKGFRVLLADNPAVARQIGDLATYAQQSKVFVMNDGEVNHYVVVLSAEPNTEGTLVEELAARGFESEDYADTTQVYRDANRKWWMCGLRGCAFVATGGLGAFALYAFGIELPYYLIGGVPPAVLAAWQFMDMVVDHGVTSKLNRPEHVLSERETCASVSSDGDRRLFVAVVPAADFTTFSNAFESRRKEGPNPYRMLPVWTPVP